MGCICQPAGVCNLCKRPVAIVVVKHIDADASHSIAGVLDEQIELPVIVVIDPKSALTIIAPEFKSCGVANISKSPGARPFIKQIACGLILVGTRLKWRLDDN